MAMKNINANTMFGQVQICLTRDDSWNTLVRKISIFFGHEFKNNLFAIITPNIGSVKDWNQACYDFLQDDEPIFLVRSVMVAGIPFELKIKHLRDSLQKTSIYSRISVAILREEKNQIYVSLSKNGNTWILRIRETERFPMHPPSVLFVNPSTWVCDGQGWPKGSHIFPGAEGSGWLCLGVTNEYLQKHPNEYNSAGIWNAQSSLEDIIQLVANYIE